MQFWRPLYDLADLAMTTLEHITRIVFADDNDTVRTLIKRCLNEYDPAWRIEEAKTGKEAMEKTLTVKPHLVLLDINLPDIQGTEVCKIIRESLPSVKIVLCSLGDAQDA